jgi:hypothetical protein
MAKLRASFLATGACVIALAATTALAAPASAGVVGTYQFGQNGTFPAGSMTFATHHVFSDAFTNGPTDTGVWSRVLTAIRIKITASSEQLDVGCVLKGTITPTGISSAADPGSVTCPSGVTGTWYAVTSAGTSTPTSPTSGTHSWSQGWAASS